MFRATLDVRFAPLSNTFEQLSLESHTIKVCMLPTLNDMEPTVFIWGGIMTILSQFFIL